MNFQFKLGAFLGGILLIQLEFLLVILNVIIFGLISEYLDIDFIHTIGQILSIGVFAIFALGHLKTSLNMFKEFEKDSFGVNLAAVQNHPSDKIDFFKIPTTRGIVWRFKKELIFIKEVFNFNFKNKDEA